MTRSLPPAHSPVSRQNRKGSKIFFLFESIQGIRLKIKIFLSTGKGITYICILIIKVDIDSGYKINSGSGLMAQLVGA